MSNNSNVQDVTMECHLTPEDGEKPQATARVHLMWEGDLIIGLRRYGAHPDREYAIVGILVKDDGTLSVRVMDGDGAYIAEPVEVKP